MNKKIIYLILIIISIIILGLGLFIIVRSSTEESKIIYKSVAQGDFVPDMRLAEDICGPMIEGVQEDNDKLDCRLIESKKISSSENMIECVDGMSSGGCFLCKFECKKIK